ncbi:MAG: hypothetical protein ACYCQL_02285 [Acidithiobacillus sp.]
MSKSDRQTEALRWLKQAQYDWRLAQYIADDYPAMSCIKNLDSYYMMARYPDAIAGESAPYELYPFFAENLGI